MSWRVLMMVGLTVVPILSQAQTGTGAMPAESTAWQAWAFGRLGGASGAPGAVAMSGGGVLTSLGGGVAASYGMVPRDGKSDG